MFEDRRVDVIGAGATGSRIALQLAKLGVTNLHVWDFDIVEEHNIANQLFEMSDIGKYKIDALKSLIEKQTGIKCNIHNAAVGKEEAAKGNAPAGEAIFLLTDTMQSRKDVWESCIKMKPRIKCLIETRMGVDTGRIYCINPCSVKHAQHWEPTLSEKVTTVSACGTSVTVGATADLLSGIAVWQFVKWWATSQGKEGASPPENEVIYSTRPCAILSSSY
jgi:molybdopterin/thiamine biosynthesis adenylyltransferase